ncbi:hypothetical protein TEPIDINF_002717 [Tepidibacillus infernus]|uniref:hypothetical protein n=1 Tax=Tepidibacillus TaxID=1494427 RepID=UPI0008532366|nr:hypothetical protein [Tepidibacillus sp. HK-1]GBF10673.1 hypothetical protein HK1_00686 [Tepidibacillus sp. HK-1]
MVPFKNTWPYEIIGEDLYFHLCPFCAKENVLLPLKIKDLKKIQSGIKKLLVLPCCHHSLTILEVDTDYLLTDKELR